MPQYLTLSKWMELSQETRNALRDIFEIRVQGPTEVENYGNSSKVISDGVYPQELIDKLSIAKLKDYCNSEETDFNLLLTRTIAIVNGEVRDPEIVSAPAVVEFEEIILPTINEETHDKSTTKRKK